MIGNLKEMNRRYLRAAIFDRYGVTMYVGVGVPIPILDEEMARSVGVGNAEIRTTVIDYGIPGAIAAELRPGHLCRAAIGAGRSQQPQGADRASLQSGTGARDRGDPQGMAAGRAVPPPGTGAAPAPGDAGQSVGGRRGGAVAMAKKRVVLTFPPELAEVPITYHLVKDYDLA